MKQILILTLLTLAFIVLPIIALAESTIPTEPYSWEQIATIPGAIAVTLLIVQCLKLPLDKVWKIPTRYVVFLIAFILMLIATSVTSELTISTIGLTLINTAIVTLGAMGAYELTFAKQNASK